MEKTCDGILFDESGQFVSLTADEFIEHLLDHIHQLRSERDRLESQLAAIQLILNDHQLVSKDSSINKF